MFHDWGYNNLRVLHAVAQGSAHGFEIMGETGLKSGQVYRALTRLEEAGLLRSRWEDPEIAVEEKRPRRRYYSITQAGRETLVESARRYSAFGDVAGAEGEEMSGA